MGLPIYQPTVPDYRFVAQAGQQFGGAIAGIFEAAAAIRERRVSNGDVYQGMVAYLDTLPDETVQALGTTKEALKASLPVGGRREPTEQYVRKVSAWAIPVTQDLHQKGGMSLGDIVDHAKRLPQLVQENKAVQSFIGDTQADAQQTGITGAALKAALPNEEAAIGAANRKLAAQGEEPFDFTKVGDPQLAAARKAMITNRETATPGVTPQTREEFQGALGRELAAMPGRPPTQKQVDDNATVQAMIAGYMPYKEPNQDEDKTTPYQRWLMGRGNRKDEDKSIQAQNEYILKLTQERNDQFKVIADWNGKLEEIKAAEKKAQETGDDYALTQVIKAYGGKPACEAEIAKAKALQADLNGEIKTQKRVLEKMAERGSGLTADANARARREKAQQTYRESQELLAAASPSGRPFRDMYAVGTFDDYKVLRRYAAAKGYGDEVVELAIQALREGGRSTAPKPQQASPSSAPLRPVGASMSDADFEAMNSKYGSR